ncbi:hypothetical protein MMC06_005973 [Schaereria dolodes]|nr:hypothetical protein [Schaereria dolodes]
MLSRSIRRAALKQQWQSSTLPPIFLLPFRARLATTSNFTDANPPPESIQSAGFYTNKSKSSYPSTQPPRPDQPSAQSASPIADLPPTPPPPPTSASTLTPTTPVSSTVRSLLPLLRAQPNHYITAHIHARPYLLTAGDTLRLPFHMPHVLPGDILRLNRASSIGSRDYTLKGAPYLDERLFECRATVVGTESEPMRVMEKTKRRQRRVKTVKSKLRFTVLKIRELKIRSLEDVEGEENRNRDEVE